MATAAAARRAAMALREGDAMAEDVLRETAAAHGRKVAAPGPGDQAVPTDRKIALATVVREGNHPFRCQRSTYLWCRRKKAWTPSLDRSG